MKKWILFAGVFLCICMSGCSDDPVGGIDNTVTVTVRGATAFGEWQRNFVGPMSDAATFAEDAANVATSLAEEFSGAVRMNISIDEQTIETINVPGGDEEIVPAAILASHDITALRLGFLPQGSMDELAVPTTVNGQRPCTCRGMGCCCTWNSCGNIYLGCDQCGRNRRAICVEGTQCWLGTEEEG